MLTVLDQSFLLPSLISKEMKASLILSHRHDQAAADTAVTSVSDVNTALGTAVKSRQVLSGSGHALLSSMLVVMKLSVSDIVMLP